jgi:hypothetical protein
LTKEKLIRQVELLHSDLEKCNKRCKRFSKECGLPDNELIQYAMEQTKEILNYIESLKDSKETPNP